MSDPANASPETISASEFKSGCLAILDRVQRTGRSITITKRGRPVATVGPVEREPFRIGFMASPETWVGDVVSPLPAQDWGPLG